MKKKNIKNPLLKRVPRELLGDWKKYLVVGLFLAFMIAYVSGMYVANGSMLTAAENGKETYKLEYGHFELKDKADAALVEAIEKGEPYTFEGQTADETTPVPVTLYENFCRNEDEDYDNDGTADGTIRVYTKTDDINLACVLDGRLPETENEIAIDRMHADNVNLKVGDTITVGKTTYEIVGLIAYVNYSTLHEKSTDLMFDALKFDVAMVTEEGFERLEKAVCYTYAWQYADEPEDEKEQKQLADDFLKVVYTQAAANGNSVEDYVPRYANPAIYFATSDMGSDEAMGGVLLDILIVIIGFIFALTISNTITKESSAIGTLRATGYTKGELIRHYLATPLIVTLIAAVVGNLLGYTVFKNIVVSMYYNSYSLPTYETIWNGDAFVKTTLIPVVLMLVINLVIIARMMQHTPLQFLRQNLKKNKNKKAMRLPHWSFFARFRTRIILQNMPNYLILSVGIFFVMVLLAMAIGLPSTLSYYQQNTKDMMFARYQYVLRSTTDESGKTITTENPDAEAFLMKSLQKKGGTFDEEVSVYGVAVDSRYVKIPELDELDDDEVYLSQPFADKYGISEGDTITLDEKYEDKQYTFTVAGVFDKSPSIAVFMPIDHYREAFDLEENAISGYLSDSSLTDIPEDAVATVITEQDITKMADQLDHSMGAYMQYFQVLCIILSIIMIYLLTKIIIEKNENAISMTKILGYRNGEIASLYLLANTIVVVIADAVGVWIGAAVMGYAWRVILESYNGWFAFVMQASDYIKMFVFVLAGYLLVMCMDFARIKKVPMDQALKNVE